MDLKHIHIQSYRSLWDVTFRPERFTVIVGANNAGKSNFLDALHFLGEVHRHGVELAVSRKGGYENIAFRRQRRTKRPIAFHVISTMSGDELATRSTIASARTDAKGIVHRRRRSHDRALVHPRRRKSEDRRGLLHSSRIDRHSRHSGWCAEPHSSNRSGPQRDHVHQRNGDRSGVGPRFRLLSTGR